MYAVEGNRGERCTCHAQGGRAVRLEFTWPGIAFWRWKAHGKDIWATGIELKWDWWKWHLLPLVVAVVFTVAGFGWGVVVGAVILSAAECVYDGAPGFHFDSLRLMRFHIGPFEFDIYTEDRK